MNPEIRMPFRRSLIALALALLAVRCTDQSGALPTALGPTAQVTQVVQDTALHILQESASAPTLETYHVSFWAWRGKATRVTVRYNTTGNRFMQFEIPKDGLVAGAGGARLAVGDSVLMTLDIDRTNFLVDFGPDGAKFSPQSPAVLGFCYGNANPDLNGDGVVDATDRALMQEIAIWYVSHPPVKQASKNDVSAKCVGALLTHFSQYAVSW